MRVMTRMEMNKKETLKGQLLDEKQGEPSTQVSQSSAHFLHV